jgi:electron transfer flavoprotein alpha subunit
MSAGILVLVEQMKGTVADITFEMLGIGRQLADGLGKPLYAVAVGQEAMAVAPSLGKADTVIVAEGADGELPSAEGLTLLLQGLVEQKQATVVLLGGTNLSLGLGTQLSVRAGLPFVNFCRRVRLENQAVVVSSQMLGGKLLADVALPDNRGIISVWPGSFPLDSGRSERTPPVEKVQLPATASKVVFRRFIEPAGGDIDITKADVLVSVGRGIQNADNVALAEELAHLLNGAVSASRPVVDQGWLPLTRQVGKSGMTVRPKLYLALGISGAPEHQEGMKDAPLIIAINTDPKAPIFDIAHYGVAMDVFELIDPLKAALEKRKAN